MDILELLKKIKEMEPDADYSRRSKEIILSGNTRAPLRRTFNVWNILIEGFKSGSAIALAALTLLIIAGGFSIWKIFSPYPIASLNTAGLQAEARDIDIQIQLADIAYNDIGYNISSSSPNEGKISLVNKTSTTAIAPANHATEKEVEQKAAQIGLSLPSTSSSTAAVTIDEALKELTQ